MIIAGTIIAPLVGRELMSKAIYNLTNSTIGFLESITFYSNINVNKQLNDMDIKVKIETIDALVKDSNIIHNLSSNICLSKIHDVIVLIQNDVKIIMNKLQIHRQKWFNKWRKTCCTKELNLLKKHINLLDNRLTYFSKILTICNK
jgi:hypothetical protein